MNIVRIQVFMVPSMKMTPFWEIVPGSLVEVDQRFTDAYCLNHWGFLMMEAVCTFETSVYFNKTMQHFFAKSYHVA
jgi:hypothetical protein